RSTCSLFSTGPPPPRALRSSPTRRSPDLAGREPHRRPAAEPPPAPARAPAGPADDHARVAGAAALLSRRREVLCQPALRHHRRRSEEHTSELQSLTNLVCRLLLEKTKPPD